MKKFSISRLIVIIACIICANNYVNAQFAFDLDKFQEVAQNAKKLNSKQTDYADYIAQSEHSLQLYLSLFETYNSDMSKDAIKVLLDNPNYEMIWEGMKDMLYALDNAYINIGLNKENYLAYLQLDIERQELDKILVKLGAERMYDDDSPLLNKKNKEKIQELYKITWNFSSKK